MAASPPVAFEQFPGMPRTVPQTFYHLRSDERAVGGSVNQAVQNVLTMEVVDAPPASEAVDVYLV